MCAGSSEGLHRGLQDCLPEVVAANTLFEEEAGGRLGCLSAFGVSSSSGSHPRLSIKSFLQFGKGVARFIGSCLNLDVDKFWIIHDPCCFWWLSFGGFLVSFALFFALFLCLYSVSQDFAICPSGAAEPLISSHRRSLTSLVNICSHQMCPCFLSIAQVGNVVCQACTLPSVCLPHRCLLPPHDLVAMCYLTGFYLATMVCFLALCLTVGALWVSLA